VRRWVWMNAWDVEGREPGELIEELRECGLNGCSLGLSYHGGRMLLGRNTRRVVFEQRPGALYFRADTARLPAGLRPEVAAEAAGAERFLRHCGLSGFDAQAWVVLCHNDALGSGAPELCVENAFGEKYSYALCPARERVQEYCVEMCRQAAAVEGVSGLDIEALSWMGYEHQGLHEKRGVPLSKEAVWWLSICCCEACRAGTGDLRAEIAGRVRAWLDDPWSAVEAGFDEVAEWRAGVQRRLLARIREETAGARLNLRVAQERQWSGGKSTLSFGEAAGLADEVTVTYFGSSTEGMESGLARLPGKRALPVNGGFVFPGPDCGSADDVAKRLALLGRAGLDGWGFYGYGMAARPHWAWLRQALKGVRQ